MTQYTKGLSFKEKLKYYLKSRAERKAVEIQDIRSKLDLTEQIGKDLDHYYGGWMDALRWCDGN